MAKKLYEEEDIREIACAIRAKCGSDQSYKVCDMASAIETIVGEVKGGDYDIIVTNNEDGTQTLDISDAVGGGGSAPLTLAYGFMPEEVDEDGNIISGTWYGPIVDNYGFRTDSNGKYGYTKLTNVNFADDVTQIGNYTFQGCRKLDLKSLPNNLTTIGEHAFQWCDNLALTSLPEGITSIGTYAFANCPKLALTSLPENLKGITTGAFSGCPKLNLTALPENITYISTYGFTSCEALALTSIPDKITSIGTSAFFCCKNLALTSLPSELKTIGESAFHQTKITIDTIPSKVTTIGPYAFKECQGITSLTFEGTPETINTNSFLQCYNLKTINVPWSYNAVANAPWGATGATIVYNYQG